MQGSEICAVVTRVADGFFVPQGEPEGTANGFSFRAIPGIEAPTQFFRVRVACDFARARELLAVWSLDSVSRERVRAAVSAALPGIVASLEDREGFVRVLAEGEDAVAVAAAAAVVKYSAAWDESDPIDVAVHDERFAVSVLFSGENYRALVRPDARPDTA